MQPTIKKLSNGLTVIIQSHPSLYTTTIAVGVKVGSRHEKQSQNGMAHFLEHMLFKGTSSKNTQVLNKMIDDIGGYTNAYTSRKSTVYYAKALTDNVHTVAEFISDIVFNSTLPDEEFQKERGVIIEEINRSLDNPSSVNFSEFMNKTFTGSLGRDILGTKEAINSYTSDGLRDFYNTFYVPNNMVLSMATSLSEHDAMDIVNKYFGVTKHNKPVPLYSKEEFSPTNSIHTKQGLNQVSSILAFELKGTEDTSLTENTKTDLLSMLLTDGMSSRLFHEIREERGLVYSISSGAYLFDETGTFMVVAGTSNEKIKEYLETVANVLKSVHETVTDEEFQILKTRYKAQMLMDKEAISRKATSNIESYFVWNKIVDDDEVVAVLDDLTVESFKEYVKDVFDSRVSSVILANKVDILDDLEFVPKLFSK